MPKRTTILALLDEDLRPEYLSRLLSPAEWRFTSRDAVIAAGRVDVLILGGRYRDDPELRDVEVGLRSCVGCAVLGDKTRLHELLHHTGATPESWTITRWDTKGVWVDGPHMWRPEGRRYGRGIAIITTQEELDTRRRNDLESDGPGSCDLDGPDEPDVSRAVLTTYIEQPLLLENHKMVVRLYCIVASHRRGAALVRRGVIGTARKPYQRGRWDDMDIHDARTLVHRDHRFPDGYPADAKTFWAKAVGVFDETIRRARPQIVACPHSKQGFEVLACDLMVDAETDDVYLLEMNRGAGHRQINAELHRWVSEGVLTSVAQFAMGLRTRGVPDAYVRVGLPHNP